MTMEWMFPPALRRGSVIRAIAPSSPFEPRLAWRALGFLAGRYRVRYDRRIFDRCGYLAGTDDARRQELQSALSEPDVDAIICARGGYGGNRIAASVEWSTLRSQPRWLIGFSDITAFHVEAMRLRVATVHGPNLTGIGRGDARGREQLIDLLEHGFGATYRLTALRSGAADGRLCGGNLSLLHSCAVAGRLEIPRGAVLFIEEVGERPYRIDRMLTTLLLGKHLDGVAAVVIGQLDDTGERSAGDAARCLEPLGVPIASGLPCGHTVHNDAIVLGAHVELASDGTFTRKSDDAS